MDNSAEKSKTLAVGKTPETLRTPVKLSQFKYLACSMPDSGRSTNKGKDTNSNGLWKGQTVSFGVKLTLLRSIVISVLLYGCESWTYNESRRQFVFYHLARPLKNVTGAGAG